MTKDLDSPKYQDLLREGKALFWKHGISRVTVKEICEKAAVSKMTFYRFFDNKIDLAKTILEKVYQEGIEEYDTLMSQDIPYKEKVEELLKNKLKHSQDISAEFLADMHTNRHQELWDYVQEVTNERIQRIVADFKAAQERGDIRQDIKLEFILYLLQKTREMALDENLAKHYDTTQDLVMEITRFFFYGILEQN